MDIPIGSPIAVLVEDLADVPAFADFVLETTSTPTPAAGGATTLSSPPLAAPTRQVSEDAVLLPSARFLAESK